MHTTDALQNAVENAAKACLSESESSKCASKTQFKSTLEKRNLEHCSWNQSLKSTQLLLLSSEIAKLCL